MAVFLTCKCIHHWVQILWRDSVSVVDMEGGRTYLSTFCASGVHAYSGPMALEARVLLQGGRSGGWQETVLLQGKQSVDVQQVICGMAGV